MNDEEFIFLLTEKRKRLEAEKLEIEKQIQFIETIIAGNSAIPKSFLRAFSKMISGPKCFQGASIVRDAIDSIQGEFSARDVLNLVFEKYPDFLDKRPYLTNLIWKICQDRKYRIVHLGTGRSPTIYSKDSVSKGISVPS